MMTGHMIMKEGGVKEDALDWMTEDLVLIPILPCILAVCRWRACLTSLNLAGFSRLWWEAALMAFLELLRDHSAGLSFHTISKLAPFRVCKVGWVRSHDTV